MIGSLIPASSTYIDHGAHWSDIIDGQGEATATGLVDIDKPGTYEISYSAVDQSGNFADPIYRIINVVDQDPPILTLLGDANITHEVGYEYFDLGANWHDNIDGNGTADSNGTVDPFTIGTYEITYSFTDSNGNTAQSVVRTVTVVDTTPPVITLRGEANMTISIDSSFVDPGAIWNDLLDSEGQAERYGEVLTDQPGKYFLSYRASDTAGNPAQPVTRLVEVFNQPPIILTSNSVSVLENNSFVIDVKATDGDTAQILNYSIIAGLDEALFKINTITGALSFINAPDYELPRDSNLDNFYEVRIRITDGYSDTDFDLKVKVIDKWENSVPSSLSLDYSSINENRPAGSTVGTFEAIDPDENESFTYSIFTQIEDDSSSDDFSEPQTQTDKIYDQEYLFKLDKNGTLSTLRSLDYETDPTYTYLQVKVEDSHGASLVQSFEIEILNIIEDLDKDGIEDAYDEDRDGDGFSNEQEIANGTDPNNQFSLTNNPYVSILDAFEEEDGTLTLSGSVDFDGDGEIVDFGFVFSSSISLDTEKSSVFWVSGKGFPDKFTLAIDEHPFSDNYYFRAWAKNSAGHGISSAKKILVTKEPQLWWGEITEYDGGWMSSDWFGTFRNYHDGWIFHSELGWLFISPDQASGVWIWTTKHSWLWTQSETWPYLYRNNSSSWLYYTSRENAKGLFYDFSTSSYNSPSDENSSDSLSEEPK